MEESRIYLVTNKSRCSNIVAAVEEALIAGIGILQYREKNDMTVDEALLFSRLAEKYEVPFIVNDNPHIASMSNAYGLHIGQKDIPLKEARKIFNGKIGVSCQTLEQALKARDDGADYISLGAAWSSKITHPDYGVIGLEIIKEAAQKIKDVPLVTIGGINSEERILSALTHVDYIAMVGSILTSNNITKTVNDYNELIKNENQRTWKRI